MARGRRPLGLAAAAGNTISTRELKRAHVFSGWTAFSKRFRTLDPYVLLRGSAAVPVRGAYDNCANLGRLSEVAPANCASPAWQNQARYQPPWQAGFALDEIRTVFFGFQDGTRAEARGRKLAGDKLEELNAIVDQIKSMQTLLKRMKAKCHCKTLEVCGKAILESGISRVETLPLPVTPEHRH